MRSEDHLVFYGMTVPKTLLRYFDSVSKEQVGCFVINCDHSVLLLAVYSGGKLRRLVFDSSNGLLKQFEVV